MRLSARRIVGAIQTLAFLFFICGLTIGATAEPDETILVYGDSISAGYGIQREEGWVELLALRLGGKMKVVNASISGETTGGGLNRFPGTIEVNKPSVVVLELGGNDGLRGYPIEQIRQNLLAMSNLAQASGAIVVIAGMEIPPNYGPRYTASFREIVVSGAQETGSFLVPFLLQGVARNRELMQADGIHPTAEAQLLLLENLWPVLSKAMDNN